MTSERETVGPWVRADGLLTRTTPRSVLVASPASTEPIVLEGAAVAIWEALATPLDDRELTIRVAARFGLAPADVVTDVAEATHALGNAGAIVGSR